jgi:integrase
VLAVTQVGRRGLSPPGPGTLAATKMHGKATAVPTPLRQARRGEAATRRRAATVVAFPGERRPQPDPATALEHVVAAVDADQAAALEREVEVLSRALAAQPRSPGPREPEGIRARHARACASRAGSACDCTPTWEAWAYSRVDRKKLRKTFPTKRQARAWRRAMLVHADRGRLRQSSPITLAEAGERWLAMARAGEITNRSGRCYKPSALRTIEQDLRLRLVPELGAHRMSDITRADLQRRVGAWSAAGLSASKARGSVNAARVLFRDFDLITGADNPLVTDPTRGLRLPHDDGQRERIATPDEARRPIDALDPPDRALWATALDAGLRHGELRSLRCEDLDLEHDRIHVCRGWDQYEGEIEPKSDAGKRTTCVTARLKTLLRQHLEHTGRGGSDLVFGSTARQPFSSSTVNDRARRAWERAREREDADGTIPGAEPIRPIGLHECRHSAVSQMLDAGVGNDKVSKFMGHASITITIDRYGHLLPGGEAEAAALLDAYHQRKNGRG